MEEKPAGESRRQQSPANSPQSGPLAQGEAQHRVQKKRAGPLSMRGQYQRSRSSGLSQEAMPDQAKTGRGKGEQVDNKVVAERIREMEETLSGTEQDVIDDFLEKSAYFFCRIKSPYAPAEFRIEFPIGSIQVISEENHKELRMRKLRYFLTQRE